MNEKLIYKNSNNETIEFSSESIYRWLNVEDLGGLTSTLQTLNSPYIDGVIDSGDSYFDAKSMTIKFVIISNSKETAIRELNRVLNPKLGIGKLIYANSDIVRVFNKVSTRVLPTLQGQRGNTYQFSAVIFDILDPIMEDEEYSQQEVTTKIDLLKFSLDISDEFEFAIVYDEGFTIVNTGDVDAPIIAELSGPLTSPIILKNVTSDKQIVVNTSILDGETLTINTDLRNINVVKTNSEGVESLAFQYIDIANTDFWQLQTGNNLINLSSGGISSQSATIKFKNKFIGV